MSIIRHPEVDHQPGIQSVNSQLEIGSLARELDLELYGMHRLSALFGSMQLINHCYERNVHERICRQDGEQPGMYSRTILDHSM